MLGLEEIHDHESHWSLWHTASLVGVFGLLAAFIRYGIPAICDLVKCWWKR